MLLALLLSGCAPDPPPTAAARPFRFVNGPEPETLDPALMTDVYGIRLAEALFEGLTRRNPADLSVEPGMAERWVTSPDGLTLTFHLREAKWSDGLPVTATDFVESWRRVLSPETGAKNAALLFPIRRARDFFEGKIRGGPPIGVRAEDDRTLVVELERPTPWFLDLTTFPTFSPVPIRAVTAHGPRWTRPENIVVNGPYRLAEWRLNAGFTLRRNPDYWEAAEVRGEEVHALTVAGQEAAFRLYRAGEADWVPRLPTALLDDLVKHPDFRTCPALATVFVRCRTNRPPFDDARVRLAFALAVDREDLCRTLFASKGATPATTFVPPGFPGYPPPPGLSPDRGRARALLAEAGFPDPSAFPPVTLLCTSSDGPRRVCEFLHYAWKEGLGVQVNVESREWAAVMDAMRRVTYDHLVYGQWEADYVEPSTFLDIFRSGSGNNRTGWADSRYDALLDEAEGATDPELRTRRYSEAERLLVTEEAPLIPLYFPATMGLVRPDIRGFFPNALDRHPIRAVWRE
ncbi:MAG: peptide ABC transporter substrate-binding protein [Planctomycetes bacterium]|nr:peptide ABC transporter substrate-binding protein [Planctomycetota bacterium]